MKAYMLGLAFAVIFAPAPASAADFRVEALGGRCLQDATGSGIWYVDTYPHDVATTSSCAFVGLSSVAPGKLGWRVGLVDLGTIAVTADFPMADSEHALSVSGQACDPLTYLGCVGIGSSRQSAMGLSAGFAYEWAALKATIGLEAGVFVYEGRFRTTVEPKAPSNFRSIQFYWSDYQATPYVGAMLRYEFLMAMLRVYNRVYAQEPNCNGCSGFADGPAQQLLIGFSIPF